MCAIDDCDERVEVFQSADRRGRKEHRCCECWRTIAPGFASAKAADDFRQGCEAWIRRREAEQHVTS